MNKTQPAPASILQRLHARISGLSYALITAILFSLKPVLVKLIYVYDLSSITVIAWRMIISMPVYLLIGVFIWRKYRQAQHKIAASDIFKAALIGLSGYYFAALFDLIGLQTITAQLERLILFSYPSIVALLSWWLFNHKFGAKMLIALVLSYAGIAVIFASDWQHMGNSIVSGSIWVMLAAICFSFYVVLSKPIIDKIGAMTFTIIAMSSSSLMIFIHFMLTQPIQSLNVPSAALWLLFSMAIIATVIPSFTMAAAISKIGPAKTALSGTIGPIVTSIFAVMLLDEFFGWPHIIGLALVVMAVVLMQSKNKPL
ncbi:MAG: DMT family transporter [Arenicellales bacterium]